MLGYLEKQEKEKGESLEKYGYMNLDRCKKKARDAYDCFINMGTGYPVRKAMAEIEFRLLDHEAKDPCRQFRDLMEKSCTFDGEKDIGKWWLN